MSGEPNSTHLTVYHYLYHQGGREGGEGGEGGREGGREGKGTEGGREGGRGRRREDGTAGREGRRGGGGREERKGGREAKEDDDQEIVQHGRRPIKMEFPYDYTCMTTAILSPVRGIPTSSLWLITLSEKQEDQHSLRERSTAAKPLWYRYVSNWPADGGSRGTGQR